MEELQLSIPGMWGDHHVLAVREALLALPGVQEVEASAALKRVQVSFDPATAGQEAILRALRAAGFEPEQAVEFAQPLENKVPGSAWFVQGVRVTQTNRLDREMSGDFRKY